MRSIKEMVNILVCSVSFKLRLSLVDLSSKRSRHTTLTEIIIADFGIRDIPMVVLLIDRSSFQRQVGHRPMSFSEVLAGAMRPQQK